MHIFPRETIIFDILNHSTLLIIWYTNFSNNLRLFPQRDVYIAKTTLQKNQFQRSQEENGYAALLLHTDRFSNS